MNDIIHYIIRFLLGEEISEETVCRIGYTSNRNLYEHYHIVFKPSGFFDENRYGSPSSMPTLPLQEIENIPLLFGDPVIERINNTLIVHADLIASTYFLITRYEEIVKRNIRDKHKRFPGQESLPYRAGFIHRPIVDEYRILIRRWLAEVHVQVPDIDKQIRNIYLTHDVDAPFLYRSWKGMLRSIMDKRGIRTTLNNTFGPSEVDPYYTFPWIFQQNKTLAIQRENKHCQTILFMKGGGNTRLDKPIYNLRSTDMLQLIKEAQTHHIQIGLHSSYRSGINPIFINKEKSHLEACIGKEVYFNRHHFLGCREPEDMDKLEAAGITDDFTMGYASVAGFRLGTSYPVRWINPVTRRISSLRLHPLTSMDCSLSEKKYMGLGYENAVEYTSDLIHRIKDTGGDVVLLWHNTSFREDKNSYHRKLYLNLLNELAQK